MKVTTKVTTPEACCENSTTGEPQQPTTDQQSGGVKGLGLDDATWTYRFKHEGKRYTLIKRNKSRDGSWWLETVIQGQRIVRSLDTNVAAVAEKRAINDHIKPAREGRWSVVATKKLRDDTARLGKVMSCYEELCVGKLPPSTVRNNLNAFRLVVRRGLGEDSMSNEALAERPATVLTGKLVADFEEWMARKAVTEKRDVEANKRSVEGYLKQARSLFKATALPRYGEKGVRLPDLDTFMTRAVDRGAKVVKLPPSDALLQKTFAAAVKLRESDRPAYMAFLLGLCSLRRGEIALAKWEWLVQLNGQCALVVPADVAKSDASRMVPIDARVALEWEEFRKIRCVGLDADEESYVLPSPRMGQGGPDARLRAQNVFKRANEFMRACGWKTNKTLHEMRALYLMWIRDSFGLDTAQAVAGHSDQRTTVNNYVGRKAVQGVTVTLPMTVAEAAAPVPAAAQAKN